MNVAGLQIMQREVKDLREMGQGALFGKSVEKGEDFF